MQNSQKLCTNDDKKLAGIHDGYPSFSCNGRLPIEISIVEDVLKNFIIIIAVARVLQYNIDVIVKCTIFQNFWKGETVQWQFLKTRKLSSLATEMVFLARLSKNVLYPLEQK